MHISTCQALAAQNAHQQYMPSAWLECALPLQAALAWALRPICTNDKICMKIKIFQKKRIFFLLKKERHSAGIDTIIPSHKYAKLRAFDNINASYRYVIAGYRAELTRFCNFVNTVPHSSSFRGKKGKKEVCPPGIATKLKSHN